MASRLGVSASYIAAMEAGRHNLTLGQIANFANAMRLGFGVSSIRPDGTPVGVRTSAARRTELASTARPSEEIHVDRTLPRLS